MLVDGPVQICPPPGDLDVGLIGEPLVTRGMTARPGGPDELGGEPLHPPVDGDVIDDDAALGEQFLHVAVRQQAAAQIAAAQIPADGQGDRFPREAEAREGEHDDVTGSVGLPLLRPTNAKRHPGWQVWYVPLAVGRVLWCAQRRPTLKERRPAELEKAMAAIETEAAPGKAGGGRHDREADRTAGLRA